MAEFGKERSARAQAAFEANLAGIHAQNAQNDWVAGEASPSPLALGQLSWAKLALGALTAQLLLAGVNQFTDMTAAQFKGYYQGYVANMPVDERVSTAPADFLNAKVEDLATSVDWRTAQSPKGGPAMTPVKDQGGCGSCWAFSATESIESDIAIETGTLLELAPQEFVDCVPNPEECGGTGGCQGATAELAFNYTMTAGQILNKDYTYTAHTGQCKLKKLPATAAGIKSFVKLPINEYAPLLAAVNKQPISISVDASKWQTYEGGVFKGCPTSTSETVDIDHAVQLVGYGTDAGTDYFIVRNSWTNHWGEKGCACPSPPAR